MKSTSDAETNSLTDTVITELECFPEACRLQVFQSGNDDIAAFTIRRYQNDLELLLRKKDSAKVTLYQLAEDALYWLYTTYPEYCDKNHLAPFFFVELVIAEVKNKYGGDTTEISKTEALQEQLEFLKKQSPTLEHLINFRQKGIVYEPIPPDNMKEKLEVGITVAQLGVLLNLFYEQGFFTGQTKIAVIKFFAAHFGTTKQPNVSYESLYGKFFKMEVNDLEVIKEKLIQMINAINKKTNSN